MPQARRSRSVGRATKPSAALTALLSAAWAALVGCGELEEERIELLRDRLAREDESYAALRGPSPGIIDQVRTALAPDQAMVSYLIIDTEETESHAVVLTREYVRQVRLRSAAGITKKVSTEAGS